MIYYILLSVSLCLEVAKNIVSKWGEKSFGFLNGLMSVNIMTSIVALAVFFRNYRYKKCLCSVIYRYGTYLRFAHIRLAKPVYNCGEERLGICLFTNLCLLLCYSHGIFRYQERRNHQPFQIVRNNAFPFFGSACFSEK